MHVGGGAIKGAGRERQVVSLTERQKTAEMARHINTEWHRERCTLAGSNFGRKAARQAARQPASYTNRQIQRQTKFMQWMHNSILIRTERAQDDLNRRRFGIRPESSYPSRRLQIVSKFLVGVVLPSMLYNRSAKTHVPN